MLLNVWLKSATKALHLTWRIIQDIVEQVFCFIQQDICESLLLLDCSLLTRLSVVWDETIQSSWLLIWVLFVNHECMHQKFPFIAESFRTEKSHNYVSSSLRRQQNELKLEIWMLSSWTLNLNFVARLKVETVDLFNAFCWYLDHLQSDKIIWTHHVYSTDFFVFRVQLSDLSMWCKCSHVHAFKRSQFLHWRLYCVLLFCASNNSLSISCAWQQMSERNEWEHDVLMNFTMLNAESWYVLNFNITIIVFINLLIFELFTSLKFLDQHAYAVFKKYFTCFISIDSDDNIYNHIMKWLDDHKIFINSRSLMIKT